ncbi:MAG: DUF2752 domain-containing protein [Bacteroidaceae bacterium]|nr:DUF2752 domain-containing protein [Bacteroidaceae bacterium]
MRSERGRLYTLLLLLTACGYIWLLTCNDGSGVFGWNGCLTRFLFNIPCPSCGTTRAIRALLHGEWLKSLYYNPLGILLAAMMAVIPIWILADLLTESASFLKTYRIIEKKLRKWPYALTGILAILINWIWNLVKYT